MNNKTVARHRQAVINVAVRRAEQLGREAFTAGRTRVPALDRDFMRWFAERPAGYGVQWLNGWLRGWDAGNLSMEGK